MGKCHFLNYSLTDAISDGQMPLYASSAAMAKGTSEFLRTGKWSNATIILDSNQRFRVHKVNTKKFT